MRAAMLLGVRLAIGTGGQRARSLMTVTASAIGVAILLLVWGIARTRVAGTTAFDPGPVTLLVAGTIGMVALPVLVLVATMARLSARVRDRRLSMLRLLGMSALHTRVVAACEVGVASLVGGVIGTAVTVAGVSLVGVGSLVPSALVAVGAVVVVVAVSVATAALPVRTSAHRARAQRRVGLLRVVPLLGGFAICWATRSPLMDDPTTLGKPEVIAILVGVLLLGVGMLLVIPVFMSLLAAVVLRFGRGPSATLLGRRLQTQPAGAPRVIAALMIGLFVVVGARGVVEAFLTTPQYVSAADFVEREQTAEVVARPRQLAATTRTVRSIEGVRRVTTYPILFGSTATAADGEQVTLVVASCSQLAGAAGDLPGCSDDVVSLVGDPLYFHRGADFLQVQRLSGWAGHDTPVTMSMRGATSIDPAVFDRATGALESTPVVVVPPQTPGISDLLPGTDQLVVAHAGPGDFLYDRFRAAGFQSATEVDLENYDFVQGMLTLVWTLAAVVLSIGLLTFTIAGIDRALSRRRELTALRLLGTPGRLLRWTQWWEAALPTIAGSLLAIAAGRYAGVTYLQLDEDRIISLNTAFTLAAVAIPASMLLAWVTTLGTTARLDPEHIRAE